MRIVFAILFILLPLSYSYPQERDSLTEQARYYREEGYRLQSAGKTGSALSFYQKAVEADPYYAEAYNDIGIIYEERGQLDEAERYYKKALQIDSDFIPAYTNLAFLYEERGNIREAAHYWRERYIRGTKGEYWHEVARQRLLQLDAHLEIRSEKIEKEAARFSRELAHRKEKERLEIIEQAKKYLNLGRKDLQRGNYAGAVKNFDIVLYLNPADHNLKSEARKMLRKAERFRIEEEALDALYGR